MAHFIEGGDLDYAIRWEAERNARRRDQVRQEKRDAIQYAIEARKKERRDKANKAGFFYLELRDVYELYGQIADKELDGYSLLGGISCRGELYVAHMRRPTHESAEYLS